MVLSQPSATLTGAVTLGLFGVSGHSAVKLDLGSLEAGQVFGWTSAACFSTRTVWQDYRIIVALSHLILDIILGNQWKGI